MNVTKLYQSIRDRKDSMQKGSYTASLFEAGIEKIAQKVGEEAVEVVIASLGEQKDRLISESADLLYHMLVLLAARDITPKEILYELEQRKK